jgi:hypothetical protein
MYARRDVNFMMSTLNFTFLHALGNVHMVRYYTVPNKLFQLKGPTFIRQRREQTILYWFIAISMTE